MQNQPRKTQCNGHRTMGYYLDPVLNEWLCRLCGEHGDAHETADETIARRAAEREAETLAQATGSVGATVTYETRHLDGTLTVDSTGSWSR